ncbi:MAG: flagellar basal body rod protein FlgB [Fimbriimonadaceae bacterium]
MKNLFGPQSRNLEKAMGLTSQRAGLLSRNLANVDVPNYKREDIDVAITPETNSDPSGGSNLHKMNEKFGRNKTAGGQSIRIDGNSVDLENEVMSIAEMEMRYQLLSEITSRYFQGLKSVIREGR